MVLLQASLATNQINQSINLVNQSIKQAPKSRFDKKTKKILAPKPSQSLHPGGYQTFGSLGHVAHALPVKQACEAVGPHVAGLEADRSRRVQTDKAFAALPLAEVPGGAQLGIHHGSVQVGGWKVVVVDLAGLGKPSTQGPRTAKEPRVGRHAEHDLARVDAVHDHVRHGLHGRQAQATVGLGRQACGLRVAQLGVVRRHLGPGPREVVAHQVEHVQERRGPAEGDVLQRPFAARQRRRQQVPRSGEGLPQSGQQGHVGLALVRVGWLLPVDIDAVEAMLVHKLTRGSG